MADDKTYIPVSCDLHSEFELLIMHNSTLQLTWQDETGQQFNSIVRPKDLQTKSGEEFIIVMDDNDQQLSIRLDRISSYKEV